MTDVSAKCPHCSQRFSVVTDFSDHCLKCAKPLFPNLLENSLSQCPLCGCAHLYRHKDFNRKIGVALIVLGVIAAYWTYGISLAVVAVLDYVISKKVRDVGICYLCEAQFRGELVTKLAAFDLVLHDHYRARRQVTAWQG